MTERFRFIRPKQDDLFVSRRTVLRGAVGLSMAAFLAACGGNDDDDDGAGAQANTSTPTTPDSTPTAASEEATADSGGEMRTIEHAYGTTEVPANPQRIVTLGYFSLEALLAIGITPIGMNLNGTPDSQHEYIRDRIAGATAIGTSLAEPDIEAILALEPDLIIGLANFFEDRREILEDIAPIAAFPFEGSNQWKETLAFFTDAVGQAEAGQALLDEYDQRLEEFRAQVGEDVVAETEVSILRVQPTGEMSIYNRGTFIGVVIEDAGFSRPEAQMTDEFATSISVEQIRDADADVLFVWGYDGTSEDASVNEFLEEWREDPLFSQLSAVQNGHAFVVDGATWIGSSILAAQAVVDDLFTIFADYEPAGSSDSESSGSTRTIETEYGPVEIPADPERVVVFDRRGTLAYMLDLGLRPVAALSAPSIYGGNGFHPLINDQTEGITAIPWPEPDLEAVATLNPDLIIGYPGDAMEDALEPLQAMAPTVPMTIDFNNPQTELRTLGEIFGLEEQAEELIAQFETDLEAASAEVTNPGTVSIVLALEDGVRVYTAENLIGQIVTGLGGEVVPDISGLGESTSEYFTLISFEQVSEITGDTIVAIVNLSEELRATYEAFLAHPLVQLLPSVQAGRIVEAESQAVFGTAGLTGQYEILEGLAEAFSSASS